MVLTIFPCNELFYEFTFAGMSFEFFILKSTQSKAQKPLKVVGYSQNGNDELDVQHEWNKK